MGVLRIGRRRRCEWLLVGLGLYALVLVGSPMLHHDFACHLKSKTHCDACLANPLAPRAEPGVRLDALRLPPVGAVEALRQEASEPSSPICSPGRSPPA